MANVYFGQLRQALRRARTAILTVGLTYFLSAAIGIVLVHTWNQFSLRYGDRIVSSAHENSPILRALHENRPMKAACMDFAANLGAATATTLAGYLAPAVFPIAVYRGWIGGIVSVDRKYRSRLTQAGEGRYYVATLILQLIPCSLAGGAGVHIGISRIRRGGPHSGPKFLVPRQAILDAVWIYALVVPLFFIASTFEFLAIPS